MTCMQATTVVGLYLKFNSYEFEHKLKHQDTHVSFLKLDINHSRSLKGKVQGGVHKFL